ncbi:MAG: glycosyltransferase, partial [Mucilaginibacter sp.]
MQRIRMSLPYFKEFGWDAEVVTIDAKYSEIVKDELLQQSVPANIKIHYIKAFSKTLTSKFGLGSLALRSLWFYRKKVDELLKKAHFDLIYFSTTEFPVCILGAGWKKRFGIPYVIDMQDPWHSEYYQDKPKDQQPPKYWFSYRMHKYLEPIAMKHVDGLISVSETYIADLKA